MLECSICLDSMGDSSLSALRCGHLLHSDCLAQHLNISPKCPICSSPSYPNDPTIRRIFLAAPEVGTPPPALEAQLEVGRLQEQLVQSEARYDLLLAEKEQADTTSVQHETAKRAAEHRLDSAERTKNRYKTERDIARAEKETAVERLTLEKNHRKLETKSFQAEKRALQGEIKTLKATVAASQPDVLPDPNRAHAMAALKQARRKGLSNTSSVEIIQPAPARSVSRDVGMPVKKKRKILVPSDEDEDEDQLGSTTEEEIDPYGEIMSLGSDDEAENEVEVTVHWSGRGNPSVDINLKLDDTIKTLAQCFTEDTGLKPQSFRGPSGTILKRLGDDKRKTVRDLLGAGPRQLNVTALGCQKK